MLKCSFKKQRFAEETQAEGSGEYGAEGWGGKGVMAA